MTGSNSKPLNVIGMGHAIIDLLYQVDKETLDSSGLSRGSMTLLTRDQSKELFHRLPGVLVCSGGSAANTMAGIQALGGNTGFLGKVADDEFGTLFRHDLMSTGCEYTLPPTYQDGATGRCIILVSDDGERTMGTYLGHRASLSIYDLNKDFLKRASYLYIEAYLFDSLRAKQTIWAALEIARHEHIKVALSLSDPLCAHRHRHELLDCIDHYVDVVCCNEHEVQALLYQDDSLTATKQLAHRTGLAAVTMGAKGSFIAYDHECFHIPARHEVNLVDTTGAGDLFAAGLLYGLSHGWSPVRSALLGNHCAGIIIEQVGSRPRKKQMEDLRMSL